MVRFTVATRSQLVKSSRIRSSPTASTSASPRYLIDGFSPNITLPSVNSTASSETRFRERNHLRTALDKAVENLVDGGFAQRADIRERLPRETSWRWPRSAHYPL